MESYLDKTDVRSPLEHQVQQKKTKDSAWRFDNINSMTIYFYETGELNRSNYVKFPLRSNAMLNLENIDKYCLLWSILAFLHHCNKNQRNRVSNYKQYFNELNINGFDFTNGFNCIDVHRFNEVNNLSINVFELNFYQDQNLRIQKLFPIEVIENDSNRVFDLLIYKNHYALIKKLKVLLVDHRKNFFCRRCLNSYTTDNMLKLQKPRGENNDITTIRTSPESYLHWKKHFHKKTLYSESMQILKLIMRKISII